MLPLNLINEIIFYAYLEALQYLNQLQQKIQPETKKRKADLEKSTTVPFDLRAYINTDIFMYTICDSYPGKCV